MRMLSPSTAAKLFMSGATAGSVVDSLHNQVLLQYDVLPIAVEWPRQLQQQFELDNSYLFASSWTVPPLLGVAYVVLGGLLPRIIQRLLGEKLGSLAPTHVGACDSPTAAKATIQSSSSAQQLQNRAFLAVTTTAVIIKLSEYLETNPVPGNMGVLLLLLAALSQWAVLDGTLVALVAAAITSIGGPLSELPFVAHGVWLYLDSAADYFPLANIPTGNPLLEWVLNEDYQNLALSHITGPCYFAVTMDAIALGRWFDNETTSENSL